MNSVPILLSLCTSLLAQNAAPQEPSRVLDFVSLQSCCPHTRELPRLPWLTMLTQEGEQDVLAIGEPDYVLSPDTAIDILRWLNQSATENDELSLQYNEDDGLLLVRGTRAAVASTRSYVDALASTVGREIEVEFSVWSSPNDPSHPTVLTAQQFREFTNGRQPLWQQRTTTRSSAAVAFDGGARTRYLRDYEVEIAKKSSIRNPVVAELFTGARANVLPFALIGCDEFALHVQAVWAERRDHADRIDLAMQDTAELDMPTVVSACGGFSGRIQNGGALCASFGGSAASGPDCVMTVCVRARTPLPGASTVPGTRAFAIGAMTTTASTSGPELPTNAFELPTGDSADPDCSFLDAARVAELLKTTIPEELLDQVDVQVLSNWLLVRGPESWCERATVFLVQLQDRTVRTQTVEHTVQARRDDLASVVEHQLSLPTLPGRRLQATRRSESPVLYDIDVEVAEAAHIADPIVRTRQLGCWMQANVTRDRDTVMLRMDVLEVAGAPLQDRRLDTLGKIGIGPTGAQTIRHNGQVTPGARTDHGDGPTIWVDGKPCRSRSETTVR